MSISAYIPQPKFFRCGLCSVRFVFVFVHILFASACASVCGILRFISSQSGHRRFKVAILVSKQPLGCPATRSGERERESSDILNKKKYETKADEWY